MVGDCKKIPLKKEKKENWPLYFWFPYILLAFLLILSRTNDVLNVFLKSVNINFLSILGEEGIDSTFHLFYSPGTILILVSFFTFLIHRMNFIEIKDSIKDSFNIIFGAGFVLLFTIPLVRIMINSGLNYNDLVSMPIAMAEGISEAMGKIYPFFSPTIGAIGAFF